MSDIGNMGAGAQALTFLSELVIALNAISGAVQTLPSVVPPPASATAPGAAGAFAIDAGFLYVCVAANTWKRTPLASW